VDSLAESGGPAASPKGNGSKPHRGHLEGNIRQRDGRWVAEIMLGYRPDGKRDRRTVSGATKRDVQQKLDALKQQFRGGTLAAPAKLTVAALLDRWLAECEAQGRRPKTLHFYRQVTRLYLAPALGRLKVTDLRPEHIQKLRDDMLARGLSPTTVRNTRTVLHSALELAVHTGVVAQNPVKRVRPPAARRAALRWPTPEEIGRLLDSAREAGDSLSPLWALAALSGRRPGELLGLGWGDVDWEAGRITVRRTLTKVPGQPPVLGEPKTNAGRRTLRLAPEALRVALVERIRRADRPRRAHPRDPGRPAARARPRPPGGGRSTGSPRAGPPSAWPRPPPWAGPRAGPRRSSRHRDPDHGDLVRPGVARPVSRAGQVGDEHDAPRPEPAGLAVAGLDLQHAREHDRELPLRRRVPVPVVPGGEPPDADRARGRERSAPGQRLVGEVRHAAVVRVEPRVPQAGRHRRHGSTRSPGCCAARPAAW
jgi:integrase